MGRTERHASTIDSMKNTILLMIILSTGLTPVDTVMYGAEDGPSGIEPLASYEKQKKNLLLQIEAIRALIASAKANDPDLRRDEARLAARHGELGQLEVMISKLPKAPAKPQKPADDKAPQPDFTLTKDDWTGYARVKTARELAGQKETSSQDEAPSEKPAGTAQDKLPANATDAETASTVAKLPKHLREAVTAALEEQQPVRDYHTFFHTGLRTLAPFTVDKASVVDASSTTTIGFFEFIYSDHWAWRPERLQLAEQRRAETEADPTITGGLISREHKVRYFGSAIADGRNGWDFAGRVSFNFGAGDEASASSITGSGDFATEVMLAKHIFRGWTKTNAYSVSLGGSVAATTDRASLRVHPRYLYGPSYTVSFDDPLSATGTCPRRGLFTLQLGATYIDSATLMTSSEKEAEAKRNPERMIDTSKLIVRTVAPGMPRYSLKRGSAIEAELFYPFGKQALITLGAKAYRLEDSDLTPWSLYLGITTPLSKAAAGFFPK